MKRLQNPLFVVVLVVAGQLLHAQASLLPVNFDKKTSFSNWWEVSTNPYARWKVGKIPIASLLDTDHTLNLHRMKGYGDDLAIMTSSSYHLPQAKSIWLSLKFNCNLKNPTSLFRLEFYDGENWHPVYLAHNKIDELLWFDLSKYGRTDFQMKFIYKSQGFEAEYIAIHNIQLHTQPPTQALSDYSHFQTYPNPFQSQLKIAFNSLDENNVEYRITDISGKIWHRNSWSVRLGSNEIELDLQELPKGMYVLTIIQNSESTHRLISKQ